jgi:hypothetical protein
MSITLPNINLATTPSPFSIVPPSNLQASQIGWMRLLNESAYTLQVNAGGMNIPIPAWSDYPIQISSGNRIFSGFSLPVWISSQLLGLVNPSYSTTLIVTFYSLGEIPASVVPLSLIRQTFVPNIVNTVGGVASSVQNDTNPTGTNVVEATVSGDIVSSVVLTNNGSLSLGTTVRPGTISINNGFGADNTNIDTSGNVNIGDGSHLTTNAINTNSSNDLAINIQSGQRLAILVNSVLIAQINASGLSLPLGGLYFNVPSAQALVNGSTISVAANALYITVSNSGNVTGIIMGNGLDGQLAIVDNEGAGTVTFAVAGANIRGGSNVIISPGQLMFAVFSHIPNVWVPLYH